MRRIAAAVALALTLSTVPASQALANPTHSQKGTPVIYLGDTPIYAGVVHTAALGEIPTHRA